MKYVYYITYALKGPTMETNKMQLPLKWSMYSYAFTMPDAAPSVRHWVFRYWQQDQH